MPGRLSGESNSADVGDRDKATGSSDDRVLAPAEVANDSPYVFSESPGSRSEVAYPVTFHMSNMDIPAQPRSSRMGITQDGVKAIPIRPWIETSLGYCRGLNKTQIASYLAALGSKNQDGTTDTLWKSYLENMAEFGEDSPEFRKLCRERGQKWFADNKKTMVESELSKSIVPVIFDLTPYCVEPLTEQTAQHRVKTYYDHYLLTHSGDDWELTRSVISSAKTALLNTLKRPEHINLAQWSRVLCDVGVDVLRTLSGKSWELDEDLPESTVMVTMRSETSIAEKDSDTETTFSIESKLIHLSGGERQEKFFATTEHHVKRDGSVDHTLPKDTEEQVE